MLGQGAGRYLIEDGELVGAAHIDLQGPDSRPDVDELREDMLDLRS